MSNEILTNVLKDADAAIATIKRAYDAKEISETECRELIQDVLDINHIDSLTSDLNLRADIRKSLTTLYQITKAVLPFI